MSGTAATSVLPWATFCSELVRVWLSAIWKLATPVREASSPRVVTAPWGTPPGGPVSAVRFTWALADAPNASAAARVGKASLLDMAASCIGFGVVIAPMRARRGYGFAQSGSLYPASSHAATAPGW